MDFSSMATSRRDQQVPLSTEDLTRIWRDFTQMWLCGYCETKYVVPGLARDCERRHEKEAE